MNPSAAWLGEIFGDEALWRPAETPRHLVDTATLAFLREVGFPAVLLDSVGVDATFLPVKGLWEADTDELFGRRTPDDDSPPTEISYCFATYGESHLMVDGDTGRVEIYVADGWDHGEGYGGLAFDGIAELAGAFGLIARFEPRITGDDPGSAIAELRAAVTEPGGEDGPFWTHVFETLDEEFGEG
ncbi:SUKH-4 family immunity protein [Phytomonospora sp. NPDC050363]|uniref:SUKH-4 family immunity protein n=1 Tax=Phytomonospora sp. NPDC050363 TaxID=3155642 RepID=UPI0033E898F1